MEIIQSDIQCEDRCIIGHLVFKNEFGLQVTKIIYDDDNIKYDDNNSITIYNFCPCCGQELEIDMEKQYVKYGGDAQLLLSNLKFTRKCEHDG